MTLSRSFVVRVVAAFVAVMSAVCLPARAEVILIDSTATGLLASSTPTPTLYWQGRNSKAVLLFLSGNTGTLQLRPGDTDHRGSLPDLLKHLTNPDETRGQYDVVLLDSPYPLSVSARSTTDHLKRIEASVLYYKKKTGLPVWVAGHSNAGMSLTYFLKYLQDEHTTDLIAGMIAMDVRSGSRFGPPIDFPMLFIHHRQDACRSAPPGDALAQYEKVKDFDKAPTAFAWITGGTDEGAEPCFGGFHLYHGADLEVAKAIDDFMASIYR